MSNVSTRHNVLPFVAGKSEPLSGQRLAKVGYKKTDNCQNPPASICVSLPYLGDAEILGAAEKFLPILRETVQKLQDGIIRGLYESRGSKLENFTSVSDEELSLEACIAFNVANNSNERITKEFLENWFSANLAAGITAKILGKLREKEGVNVSPDDVRIKQFLSGKSGLFAALAVKNTLLGTEQIATLEQIIVDNAPESDRITEWAIDRLTEMSRKNASLDALY